MILNRLEFLAMNNPLRAAIQRYVEVPRFLRLGGKQTGGRVLEIGCGRGVGVKLILDKFGAATVDAFDLDPRMVALAQRRLLSRGSNVRLWVGDAVSIEAPEAVYDAVFDFGIVHHVPAWRDALFQVCRVLKPGGLFYAEEPLGRMLNHPLMHRLFAHPVEDRFEASDFHAALQKAGLRVEQEEFSWQMLWCVARKCPSNTIDMQPSAVPGYKRAGGRLLLQMQVTLRKRECW